MLKHRILNCIFSKQIGMYILRKYNQTGLQVSILQKLSFIVCCYGCLYWTMVKILILPQYSIEILPMCLFIRLSADIHSSSLNIVANSTSWTCCQWYARRWIIYNDTDLTLAWYWWRNKYCTSIAIVLVGTHWNIYLENICNENISRAVTHVCNIMFLTLRQCTPEAVECHWNPTGWPSVHWDTTRWPSKYLQGTLEHHWKNLIEIAPHWNTTGETLTIATYTGTTVVDAITQLSSSGNPEPICIVGTQWKTTEATSTCWFHWNHTGWC